MIASRLHSRDCQGKLVHFLYKRQRSTYSVRVPWWFYGVYMCSRYMFTYPHPIPSMRHYAPVILYAPSHKKMGHPRPCRVCRFFRFLLCTSVPAAVDHGGLACAKKPAFGRAATIAVHFWMNMPVNEKDPKIHHLSVFPPGISTHFRTSKAVVRWWKSRTFLHFSWLKQHINDIGLRWYYLIYHTHIQTGAPQ